MTSKASVSVLAWAHLPRLHKTHKEYPLRFSRKYHGTTSLATAPHLIADESHQHRQLLTSCSQQSNSTPQADQCSIVHVLLEGEHPATPHLLTTAGGFTLRQPGSSSFAGWQVQKVSATALGSGGGGCPASLLRLPEAPRKVRQAVSQGRGTRQ